MLEDYFSLQLQFAEQYAAVAGVPLAISVASCTNLRRRLNLWGPAGESRWNEFLAQVGRSIESQSDTPSIFMEFYETRPRLLDRLSFGCFSFDSPDASGVLRIHFVPPTNTCSSPLASENTDSRRQELRALFSYVRRTERHVLSVRGISWLYNLEAYKRLFPIEYAASARPVVFPLHLNGSSTWGQVLNWRQHVKPGMRNAVIEGLPAMKLDAPWKVFPYQAMTATSEVEKFFELLI